MIIHDIEQRSPEWYELRAGMPTASEFGKIVTSKGEPSKQAAAYATTLAVELFAGQPLDAWEGNQWTDRGRVLEEDALSLYEFLTNSTVERVGFITDDAKTMGCSPDGLVGPKGMVETKCLKAERHADVIMYFQRHGRCPTDYVQQPQGQTMIAERQWCDLMFYHPFLPPLIIRQTPDLDIQRSLRSHIRNLLVDRDSVLAALKAQEKRETHAKVSASTKAQSKPAHITAGAKPSSQIPY